MAAVNIDRGSVIGGTRLFDPQMAGELLLAVARSDSAALLDALK